MATFRVVGKDGARPDWIQCTACKKRRKLLPGSFDLPAGQWYCVMNAQDPVNNSCKASEKDDRWYKDYLELLVPNDNGNEPETASESPPRMRTGIRSSALDEPDVTIIVGGTEYKDWSQSLCRWSDYFDKALKSGMRESESMTFAFPDRDPEEWKWIASLAAPFSKEKISKTNVWKAASWFDELLSESGLELCDTVVRMEILSEISRKLAPALANPDNKEYASLDVKRGLDMLLETTCNCLKFNLKSSKRLCLYFLHEVLHVRFLLVKENLERITTIMKDNEDVRLALLKKLSRFLPKNFSEQQIKLLLDNGMLYEIVYLELSRKKLKRRLAHLADSVAKSNAIIGRRREAARVNEI